MVPYATTSFDPIPSNILRAWSSRPALAYPPSITVSRWTSRADAGAARNSLRVREVAAPVVEADRGGVHGSLAVRRCVEGRQDKVWSWFAKACIIDVHVMASFSCNMLKACQA
jgi:hypothetical protein